MNIKSGNGFDEMRRTDRLFNNVLMLYAGVEKRKRNKAIYDIRQFGICELDTDELIREMVDLMYTSEIVSYPYINQTLTDLLDY